MRYFEVEFSLGSEYNFAVVTSGCMLALDTPTYDEATEFFNKNDDFFRYKETGFQFVSNLKEISSEKAHRMFNMENEEKFPVFKRE